MRGATSPQVVLSYLHIYLLHTFYCGIGEVPINCWPHRVLCALWTRRPILKVTMGCCMELAILQNRHYFEGECWCIGCALGIFLGP